MLWLFVTGLWVALLSAPLLFLFFLLPPGRSCPECDGETLLIRSRALRPLRRLLGMRWCPRCGWQGVMRYETWPLPLPKFEVIPDPDPADSVPPPQRHES